MDQHLTELAVLYEIVSFNFSNFEKELFREVVSKATRLFEARRVVLVIFEESPTVSHLWCFPENFLKDQESLLDYVRQNQGSPMVYLSDLQKKGTQGLLFLERKREFAPHERRLLDILSTRVAELVQGYFRKKRLIYLSTRDSLTGLFNRAYFEEELRRLEKGRFFPVTLVLCDLDNLKVVNDALGHWQGDELLRRAAKVLADSVRGSDVVARVGGDEFAVLLPKTDRKSAEKVVKRILEAIERSNSQHHNSLLSLSVGVATAEDPSKPLMEVYSEADNAMYRDKLARGVGSYCAVVRVLRAALGEKDYVAEGHTERVKKLACMLGEAVGLSRSELDTLSLLADLHDIGKLAMPEHILFKPSVLTEEEWEEIKHHPQVGYRIALSSPELASVAELIHQHHERWDGRGYPRGLRGEEIHILSRILAIADAFDTMRSNRPYRPARSHEEALEELKRCAGTQFDPHLVEVFVKLVR